MSCGCLPSCTIPTCCSPSCGSSSCYPVSGLGPLKSCGQGQCGGAVSASSLGIVSGANVSCICQTPPSEIIIKPSPVCVTIPGAILTATCEPVRIGGHSACGGSGSQGLSCGKQSSICCNPCS